MRAKTFVFLMLLLMGFTAGLFAFTATTGRQQEKTDCPAGKACQGATTNSEVQAADGMMWESVTRHLLSAVQ